MTAKMVPWKTQDLKPASNNERDFDNDGKMRGIWEREVNAEQREKVKCPHCWSRRLERWGRDQNVGGSSS
jgi:hypothetical protein